MTGARDEEDEREHGGAEQPGTFAWTWKRVQPAVRRLSLRMLRSPPEADEVTQEAGLVLFLEIEVKRTLKMPQDKDGVKTAIRIACESARHDCIDILRRRPMRIAAVGEAGEAERVMYSRAEQRLDAIRTLRRMNLSEEQARQLLKMGEEGPADAKTRQRLSRLRKKLKLLMDNGEELDGDNHGR